MHTLLSLCFNLWFLFHSKYFNLGLPNAFVSHVFFALLIMLPLLFHRIYVSSEAIVCGYCPTERGETSAAAASACTAYGRICRSFTNCDPWWIPSYLLSSSIWGCSTSASSSGIDVSTFGIVARMETQWLFTYIWTSLSTTTGSCSEYHFSYA